MPFTNLPGIDRTLQDGNLTIPSTNDSPIVCVIGTAAQGDAETLFTVVRPQDASRVFGKDGTLVRGMYEAANTGATNIRLFRIGATAARIEGLGDGGDGGLTVETVEKDADAGSNYKIWFTASSGRLRVYRTSDDVLVFDSGDGTVDSEVDLGEVVVSGTADGGIDVGSSAATAVDLDAVDAVDTNVVVVDGTDGINLTRMQMYEHLDRAYELLADAELAVVVPQNVFLDDKNVCDMEQATASGLLASITGHEDITIGGSTDILGRLYTEEYNGEKYYFWDLDFDGRAEIVPDVRGLSPSQLTTLSGGQHSIAAVVAGDSADLVDADFHEVNFAYQLADFCYRSSHLNTDMHGCIGVLPPASFSARDVALWVGAAPVTSINSSGETVIDSNGRGLLGNKWVAGRIASGTIAAHNIDGEAAANGGFIATDDGWINGIQLKDDNDKLIDIGKYLDLVAGYLRLVNPSRSTAYVGSGAASYAGLLATLPAASAPTNKVVNGVSLPFRINSTKLDLLAGKRFVAFTGKPKGTVVADGPTGSRPDSDYNRRSTMRIVKAAMDTVRLVGEPFLGEGMSGSQLAALETAVSRALGELVEARVLVRFDARVTASALERVQGKCKIQLVLVPAFELRQISVTVALAAA